jgi:GDP-L-fucose synthase
MSSLAGKRVWVAGHLGMVGAALVRRLASEDCHILTVDRDHLDLRRQAETEAWMAQTRPQAIFLAAGTVGGILANDSAPAEFLYDNLMIAANIAEAARRQGVEKLLFLGSSCIYPKFAPQPIVEDALLTGLLEPTNEAYAVAKIAGVKLMAAYRRQYGCDFISAMPTNLYGPGDNFDPLGGHVLPSLIHKLHEAKASGATSMTIWGTGTPRREFLHVDDCADALVHLMKVYSDDGFINVGGGEEISIGDLAGMIAEVVGYSGQIACDPDMPDGTPRKLLDARRLQAMGWSPNIPLRRGLDATYAWYLSHIAR